MNPITLISQAFKLAANYFDYKTTLAKERARNHRYELVIKTESQEDNTFQKWRYFILNNQVPTELDLARAADLESRYVRHKARRKQAERAFDLATGGAGEGVPLEEQVDP